MLRSKSATVASQALPPAVIEQKWDAPTIPPAPPVAPDHDETTEGWQRPAEMPSAAIEAEHEEEPLKIHANLRPKDRPPESQNTVPFWPARGMFVDSDNHFPVADPVVHAAKLAFVRDMKPDLWINLGDLLDFWLASRFPKEIGRAHVLNSSHLVISYAVFCL